MLKSLRTLVLPALSLGAAALLPAGATAAPLMQTPAASADHIAFSYAGDLWVVGTDGGEARRLTVGVGLETDPYFSPDGRWVAFTGEYEGNFDAYLVEAGGGVPRRLTHHPAAERVTGWTPDGKRVLFRSPRNSASSRYNRLFTVEVEGGPAAEVPLPSAEQGSFSPDGTRLAYVPTWQRNSDPNDYAPWKRYRGGQTASIRIARLSDSAIESTVPTAGSSDFNPLWVGNRVYFLSDRGAAANRPAPTGLFAYDPATRAVTEVVKGGGGDILSAGAGPGFLVYEKLGELHRLDLSPDGGAARSRKLDVRITADLPAVRPYYRKVVDRIKGAAISPTGVRVAFEARGEILTVPAEKGDIRNLTRTPGVAERSPAWSPDGRRVAYFSDESGEYALHIAEQDGAGEVRKIGLGDPPSFFYDPVWSPDGRKIAYADKRLAFWYVDVEKGRPVRVDAHTYESPVRWARPVWSPDSRWLVYPKQLPNHLHALFVHSLESGQTRQITDGMSDALYPAFDKDGRHLYFTASTDVGPLTGWLDLSSFRRPYTRSVYVTVLRKDLPSPLTPLSDEEPGAAATADQEDEEDDGASPAGPVRIDFDGIDQRTLALPVPARGYFGLATGKSGVVFLLELPEVLGFGSEGAILHRFDLATRETEVMAEGVGNDWEDLEQLSSEFFQVSHDGEKLLFRRKDQWYVVPADEAPEGEAGALALDGLEVYVDPRAEWRQMFAEAFRIQRDFFYDAGLHGLDLAAARKRYEPYLADIGHPADLNYLFADLTGELTIGHMFVGGGEGPEVPPVGGGLLGADYDIDRGRYRFARIYNGGSWNPDLSAPLTQPGVNVREGEYLLAVNGKDLKATDDVHRLFEGTAGKSVVIRVGPNPDGRGAREVTVVPVESEESLRQYAWIEGNRRKVDQLSGGRLAYVFLPNTATAGYVSFNRYFFAQIDKQGVVIDERYNGGGFAADYIIDYLRRPLLNYWSTREGADLRTPVGAIFGPKVMLINEWSASGGDALPWYFRQTRLGPLVGKRTWGGLVGIYGYPELMNGAGMTAPRIAFRNLEGQWDVENVGVAPDVEVEDDPKAWRQGRDPQLEKAVELALEELKRNPPPQVPKRPAGPNYSGQ
ncbi:MAG TPA: PDZ domain-containing protein [Thermoanaerobaculia bacterium]|nr:PDZ domain-containing protein [Thermoanaerobaculia bacterium]